MPNAPSLSLGARLSTSCPLRLVGVGLPQMPLEPTKKQQGAWLCVKPRDLRERRGERLTITLFGGFGGFTPLKEQRAQPFALRHLFFFALCKFYRFSIGVL